MTILTKTLYEALKKCVERFRTESEEGEKSDGFEVVSAACDILFTFIDVAYHEDVSKDLKAFISASQPSIDALLPILEPYLERTLSNACFNLSPRSPIRFDSFFDQNKEYILNRGVDFNLMIIGRIGSGKSTLIDTLFNAAVSRVHHKITDQGADSKWPDSCQVKVVRHVFEEEGLRIRLNIYDTSGFGDLVDNSNCNFPIISKIRDLYSDHLDKEMDKNRSVIPFDNRIHCCLYVIPPSGHCLPELDVKCLKDLVPIVNVIPVIGRADSLNQEELSAYKQRIRNDFASNQINFYPHTRFTLQVERQAVKEEFDSLEESLPLAVIGGNHFDRTKKQLLRKTPFGDINIFDPAVCDLKLLSDILIGKHTLSLIQTTDKIFYENHRKLFLENK